MTQPLINLTQVPGCIQRLLYDITGEFSSQNPTGWDDGSHTSGNPAISDVETAIAEVTLPDGQVLTFDIYSDGSSTIAFPNTDNGYVILTGISALNGIINVKVTYTGSSIDGAPASDFEIIAEKKFLNTCKAECCISKLGAQLETNEVKNCAPCKKAKEKVFYEVADLLLAAQTQYDCENWNLVTETMARIDMLCAANGCNC